MVWSDSTVSSLRVNQRAHFDPWDVSVKACRLLHKFKWPSALSDHEIWPKINIHSHIAKHLQPCVRSAVSDLLTYTHKHFSHGNWGYRTTLMCLTWLLCTLKNCHGDTEITGVYNFHWSLWLKMVAIAPKLLTLSKPWLLCFFVFFSKAQQREKPRDKREGVPVVD